MLRVPHGTAGEFRGLAVPQRHPHPCLPLQRAAVPGCLRALHLLFPIPVGGKLPATLQIIPRICLLSVRSEM